MQIKESLTHRRTVYKTLRRPSRLYYITERALLHYHGLSSVFYDWKKWERNFEEREEFRNVTGLETENKNQCIESLLLIVTVCL